MNDRTPDSRQHTPTVVLVVHNDPVTGKQITKQTTDRGFLIGMIYGIAEIGPGRWRVTRIESDKDYVDRFTTEVQRRIYVEKE